MPTHLPAVRRPIRRLSLPDTVRFFVLLARSHWLRRRLNAAHRRVDRFETGTDFVLVPAADLRRLARRWLDTHEEIAGLLSLPMPPHVAQVRAVLRHASGKR